jgi:hypothetical protein
MMEKHDTAIEWPALAASALPRAAYVKAVNVADLPADVQAGAEGRTRLYALHDGEGARLARGADRRMALALAPRNDDAAVPVH